MLIYYHKLEWIGKYNHNQMLMIALVLHNIYINMEILLAILLLKITSKISLK